MASTMAKKTSKAKTVKKMKTKKKIPGKKFAKVIVLKNGSMRSFGGKKVTHERTSPKTRYFHEK